MCEGGEGYFCWGGASVPQLYAMAILKTQAWLFYLSSIQRFTHQSYEIKSIVGMAFKYSKNYRRFVHVHILTFIPEYFAFSLFLRYISSFIEIYWNWNFFSSHPSLRKLVQSCYEYVNTMFLHCLLSLWTGLI